MKEFFKKSGIVSIITSIIFAILGVVMARNPGEIIKLISAILGITILLVGVEKIISYIVFKGNKDFYNYDLIYGIIAIIIGILIMVYSNTFASIVGIVIGIWIAYEASLKIVLSIKLKNVGVASWGIMLGLSLMTLLVGIFVIFNQSSIVVATGIVMIVYAVINIIDEIMFMQYIDKLVD